MEHRLVLREPSRLARKWLLVAFVLLLHFMIVQPAGFPLTIAPLAGLVFFAWNYQVKMTLAGYIGWALLALVPFANMALSLSAYSVDFVRSYALWMFNLTLLWLGVNARIGRPASWLPTAAFAALIFLTVFSAVQSTLVYLGSDALFDLFGSHQYMGESNAKNVVVGRFGRASALYLEPSFSAFVLLTLMTLCLLAGYWARLALLICGVAFLFNQSMTGIVAFVAIATLYLALERPEWSRRLLNIGAAIVLAATVAFLMRSYLLYRLLEFGMEGTSGYYRMVAPIVVLRDVLATRPLGVPFGQLQSVLGSYRIAHGASIGTSLDNGAYVLVFYFGWLGVAALIVLLGALLRGWLTGNRPLLVGSTYLLFSLLFSGGILLPEYAFLVMLIIYQYRLAVAGSPTGQTYAPAST
jgi:putative colanic acid polymerase